MFDFISYTRDTGFTVTVRPGIENVLISLEIRDKDGFFGRHDITHAEASACENIDVHMGRVLDQLAAEIGSRKAGYYASRHKSHELREREKFFREA